MVGVTDLQERASGHSSRPYLIALVAAVILNLGLRLRILEHLLRAHGTTPWLLLVIQRGLLLLFALLLVGFCWLLLVLGRRAAAHAGNALPHASLERALLLAGGCGAWGETMRQLAAIAGRET